MEDEIRNKAISKSIHKSNKQHERANGNTTGGPTASSISRVSSLLCNHRLACVGIGTRGGGATLVRAQGLNLCKSSEKLRET
jgi:hypothetical protein